jgi:superfamily II DNA or RNA helicase
VTSPVLRDYQLAAVEAVETCPEWYCLIELPTGSGKTLVFSEVICRRGGRALVVAHRDELIAQAEEKLILSGIDPASIGRVKAKRDEVSSPVVLASMQTLARKPRRDRLIASQREAGIFQTVVIDEAHHVPAKSYLDLLDALDTAADELGDGPLVLGVTATPNRLGVDEVFGSPIFSRDLVDMIAEGWLADLRGRRIGIDLNLGDVRRSRGDYAEADLAIALGDAGAPVAVADGWLEHGEDRPTIVFTAGVSLAYETAEAFRDRDVEAEAIDGEMPLDDRRAVLDRFRSGETKVVVNCSILTEGVDLPATSCIVVARPTLSSILFAQMIGRGTRRVPGKDDCLILDVVGATDRHSLSALERNEAVSLESLAGVKLEEGGSLLEAALADQPRRERLAALLGVHGQLVAEDVDLFGRRRLRWINLLMSPTTYALSLGDAGHVVLVVDDDTSPAKTTAPSCAVYRLAKDEEPETLGTDLHIDAATVLAEQTASTYGAHTLTSVKARWLGLPPTDRQVDTLVRMRGVQPDVAWSLTRGQASDLLEATFAARRVTQARRRGQIA